MNATRFTVSVAVVLFWLLSAASGAGDSDPQSKPQAYSPNDEILATMGEYVAAYNRHDAAGVASKWTEKGIYEDGQSGERLAGREAIRREFSSLLSKEDRSLTVHIDQIRFIRPDVAQITGQAVAASLGESARESQFRAVFVRERGHWLVDSVAESLLPVTGKPCDRLRDLEFLVGQWRDDNADVRNHHGALECRSLIPCSFIQRAARRRYDSGGHASYRLGPAAEANSVLDV
jgi:uncharacterized protein (TIGR02246 family)